MLKLRFVAPIPAPPRLPTSDEVVRLWQVFAQILQTFDLIRGRCFSAVRGSFDPAQIIDYQGFCAGSKDPRTAEKQTFPSCCPKFNHNLATLQPCNPATLQPCNLATLQPCNPATLQPCNLATLQPCNPATLDDHPTKSRPAACLREVVKIDAFRQIAPV